MTSVDGRVRDVYNGMPASDLGEQGWESPWSGPNGGQCVQTKQLADGRVALCQRVQPDPNNRTLELTTLGGPARVVQLEVYEMNSAW